MKHATAATRTVVIALLAAVCGGCGNGEEKPSPTGTTATASASATVSAPASGGAATVAARSGDLGRILVDGQGRTLYLFEADESSKSTCSGGCAQAWPPLTTSGKPKAGQDAKADLLGTTTRNDGGTQVTYNGHPLYYFKGDKEPGDTNGQDLDQFGAKWFVLDEDGNKIEGQGGNGGY